MKFLFPFVCLLVCSSAYAQTQVCPLNNNFSFGSLTHWWAYTGNSGSGDAQPYDSSKAAAAGGTIGATNLSEYLLPGVGGIQILSSASNDPFGGFPSIPKINGYQYTNSVLLGSTSITRSGEAAGGGYIRGISYRINVPPGPVNEPYTMTYAYAMVLENGTHPSNEQPLFSATLTSNDSVITCASPKYFLPTLGSGTGQDTGAPLDSAVAISEGFYLSPRASPNMAAGGPSNETGFLHDVWAKNWTEVTFDLSPYRGQPVTLTFEADNCVPGGHFAYAYVALRNVCAGLLISGATLACLNSTLTYSVPGLTGATYQWGVPPGWTVVSGSDSNILQVTVGPAGGKISALEVNSCANLKDTINVIPVLPTIAGAVNPGGEVCAGTNTSPMLLTGNRGSIINWIASTDGTTWTGLGDTTASYTAQNLGITTVFRALIQNGPSCDVDSSAAAIITVDPKSVGGQLSPSQMVICLGQNKDDLLKLVGQTGGAVNWQSSPDAVNWTPFSPAYTQNEYSLPPTLAAPTDYRVIVKSGLCPTDTSSIAFVDFVNVLFPQASADPADTVICYGATVPLNAVISVGTNYSWANTSTLATPGNGNVDVTPYTISTIASPPETTLYILTVENAGCPNPLLDTFLIHVTAPILVNAGQDTSVVIGQPLQLHASSNDTTAGGDTFVWTPVIGLNNPDIPDPVAVFGPETDSVRYLVKATSVFGCYGVADILVEVFKTSPNIFVPNAFTPGNGTNNIFRPIPVGISSLQFFRVYNRWGQLVYATSSIGPGWDGRLNGRLAEPGTYVWMVEGTTYTGKTIFHKGTMILVR
jgi:gliding motility-associated-like protein